MTQLELPPPVVRAYDQTSHFVTEFGVWYVAQLYSLAGVFAGILEGVFNESKGLLIKTRDTVEKNDGFKEIKSKTNETTKAAHDSLTNGFTQAQQQAQQTQQKAQQAVNDVKRDTKQSARR